MNDPKTVIGLEVHVLLDTASKLFCGCRVVGPDAMPNSSCCPVCLGMPGAKPVLNRRAVEIALMVALSLNCNVSSEFFFSRKTYFYPDLAKNFQITQFEFPVGKNGFIKLDSGKKIRVKRIQLEEDPGALVHEGKIGSSDYCLVDYNRSGNPLVEIVTEPDLSSIEEVKEFFSKLKSVVEYLGVFDAQKSVLKADTNVSITGGNRVEVKNVTGTKNIESAVQFEVSRQKAILIEGKKIGLETRGFDEETLSTFSLRGKESAADYGYIVEPDIPKVVVAKKWLLELKSQLPELAQQKISRLKKEFGLSDYDARVICSEKELSELFEAAAKKVNPVLAARFLSRELLGILNYNNLALKELHLDFGEMVFLLELLESGKVSEKNAKEAMINYATKKIIPKEFLEKNNLLKDLGESVLVAAVEKVLAQNKPAFDDLKSGNKKALNFLVGLVMRETKGKAEARKVQEIIEEKI